MRRKAFLGKFRCKACGYRFKRKLYSPDDPDPQCPRRECRAVQTAIGMDVSAGKAPGVGGNVMVKAMDATADIVMNDYGMTDLASARTGESMAPKLPPGQQARADAMFDPSRRGQVFGSTIGNPLAMAAQGIVANTMAGMSSPTSAIRDQGVDAMTALHTKRYKPPVSFVNKA